MEKKALVVVVVAVILAVAGFFYWKTYYTPPVREEAPAKKSADLGSEIYREANNPIEGELPGNPLEGVYKNPFE